MHKKRREYTDWQIARRLRDTCLSRVRTAKGGMVRNELDTNKSDSTKFWRSIHEIIPKNKKNNKKIQLVNQNTQQVISEIDTATYI